MGNPYIGITGFMSAEEVSATLGFVPPLQKHRLIMVGVLVSYKTLRGIPNKFPHRYPALWKIAEIFPDYPLALNLIYYHTSEKETLCEQLIGITELDDLRFHGFQLNIAWPDPAILGEYRSRYPEKKIVLQISTRAFEMIDHSPQRLANVIFDEYQELIDYLLLDASGGYGKLLDPKKTGEYLDALVQREVNVELGIAGGLGPDTLETISSLVERFPALSIDAEGRLRDPGDYLDLNIVQEYLLRASEIIF